MSAGVGALTALSSLLYLLLAPRATQSWWSPDHPASHLPLPTPLPLVAAADEDEGDASISGAATITDVSFLLKLAVSLAAGAMCACLFLPSLRYCRCLHEARAAYADAATSGGNSANVRTALWRLVWATLAFSTPLLLVAVWGGPLLGSPVESWQPAVGALFPAGGWTGMRMTAAVLAVLTQLSCVRLMAQVYLMSGKRTMVETLMETAGLCVKLNSDTTPAAASSGKAAGSSSSSAAGEASDGSGPAHGLSVQSIDMILTTLQQLYLRPIVSISLTALHLLAVPITLACLLVLYIRLGGVDAGIGSALRSGLLSLGVDSIAVFTRKNRPVPEELQKIKSLVADIFPAASDVISPAVARSVLGYLLLTVALVLAGVQLLGLVYFSRLRPSMTATGIAVDRRTAKAAVPAPRSADAAAAAATSAAGSSKKAK